MGQIFYDHTEHRSGTRLPSDVIKAGKPLPGLEKYTGADLLLSPLSIPIRPLDDSAASMKSLQRHTEAGLLVQRKTGRDAINSIAHYDQILLRMLQWTPHPWLVLVGDYSCDRDMNVKIDGQASDWNYFSFIGAIEWWTLRGIEGCNGVGHYTNLQRDSLLLPWINNWLRRLEDDKWEGVTKHTISAHIPKQILGDYDWVSIATSIGIGFGHEKAEWLRDNFSGLGQFLNYFTNERNMKDELVKETKGIGPSHFKKVRQRFGVDEPDTALLIMNTSPKYEEN